MFLLYFVLVSSSVTFLMNQIRQSSYRIDVHEFTTQLPKYMMMSLDRMDMDIQVNKALLSSHSSRTNPVAGNDMRNPEKVRRPRHHHHDSAFDANSMEFFHHNFRQKNMLDYLQHSSQDDVVKMKVYQEYRRQYCTTEPSVTGTCLKAGTWPDLAEFDFL